MDTPIVDEICATRSTVNVSPTQGEGTVEVKVSGGGVLPPATDLVREAFAAAGEKRFFLARVFYRTIFGADWKHAVLGFAYFKCLDTLVDEDPDARRALAVLAAQRRFIARVYAGDAIDGLAPPERFGAPFFAYDRAIGSPLRVEFETILASMDLDTRRRGRALDAAALDAYVLEVGGGVFRSLMYHAAPDVVLPTGFLEHASRAYLKADALIDLRHDLALGVVNVPAEDVERYGITLDCSDSALRSWIEREAGRVLDDFATALAEGRRLGRWSLRLLAWLYLATKRRGLRRFLVREGLRPAPQAAFSLGMPSR